jgi:hypothetical protein
MCGCILVLLAMVSPRLALFLLWAFTNRMTVAFNSGWVGLLGFLFLPWTTLAWTAVYAPRSGVTGFGWFLVIFAFLVDLASYGGGSRARARRSAAST